MRGGEIKKNDGGVNSSTYLIYYKIKNFCKWHNITSPSKIKK
jgi:hypothetical protein